MNITINRAIKDNKIAYKFILDEDTKQKVGKIINVLGNEYKLPNGVFELQEDLIDGREIIIFPENDEKFYNIMYSFLQQLPKTYEEILTKQETEKVSSKTQMENIVELLKNRNNVPNSIIHAISLLLEEEIICEDDIKEIVKTLVEFL